MDDSQLRQDSSSRLAALTALYGAAMQKENAVQAGVVAVYTVAFAFAGVMISAIAGHPDTFRGFRVAVAPLPIWVLVTMAVVIGRTAAPNRRVARHLEMRLDAIAGVDRQAVERRATDRIWGAIVGAALAVFAALGVLLAMTIYCLVRASSSGWGWLPWAALYTAFAFGLFAASSKRRRSVFDGPGNRS